MQFLLQIVDKVTSNEKIRSHFFFFELRTWSDSSRSHLIITFYVLIHGKK